MQSIPYSWIMVSCKIETQRMFCSSLKLIRDFSVLNFHLRTNGGLHNVDGASTFAKKFIESPYFILVNSYARVIISMTESSQWVYSIILHNSYVSENRVPLITYIHTKKISNYQKRYSTSTSKWSFHCFCPYKLHISQTSNSKPTFLLKHFYNFSILFKL